MVNGVSWTPLGMTVQADNTLQFSVAGNPVTLTSGSLVGQSQGIEQINVQLGKLDSLAQLLIQRTNDAQANGVTPAGTPGQPLFSGTDATDIGIAMADGSGLATAPAGAGANSRDIGNLMALREALANGGPAQFADRMLFELSSTISGRGITRDALQTIAETAEVALTAETGVDLDTEAANLIRFQQAFQASGRVIQVAADIFDTMLGIR